MKYLIYGYYGYNNLGDDLLLDTIINRIKEKDRDAVFTILNKSSNSLKEYPNVCYTNIRDILHGSKNKVLKFWRFFSAFKKYIDECDVFLLGGGTIFMDSNKASFLMIYLSFFVSYAKSIGKKVVLIGVGIDILNNFFSIVSMKKILRNSDLVYCRDALSFQIAKKLNSTSNALLAQDLVFGYYWNNSVLRDDSVHCGHKTIGISLIDYSDKYGENYIPELNNILNDYINKGFKIKLLSFQINTDKADNLFYEQLMHHENIEIVNLNIGNFSEQFNALDYVLSMRFHGIVLGVLFHKYTLGIVHEVKNQQLCLEIGVNYLFLNDLTLDKVVNSDFRRSDAEMLAKLALNSGANFDFVSRGEI
ncbi:polysaccharide pyruvyl transferase family protein [Campylobacter concisus]|uniref:Polysaccharide pyruvyl transferase domain-containing protein n=1 Tax=Campylobacter concisus TaxID=199 RepID=A0A7S9RGF2_9BACT|nr:polysaccharide pyruvyl transferase family protein [Campylobacter concisus]QPH91366.1 hypothetical protein CVT01_02105 [Campylobacter concisus]